MKIGANVLYKILTEGYDCDGWSKVDEFLVGSDDEDGGGDYEAILTFEGKFYKCCYSNWDIRNTDYDEEEDSVGPRCDLDTQLQEVFPYEKTITLYK